MTLEQLRAAVAAAAVAAATVGAASCARQRVRHPDPPVVSRHLGESTASPGRDHDRPVARSLDTQEVSATITRRPAGSPPATPSPSPPTPTPTPTPPAQAQQPGVFSPPPPPPPP